MFQRVRIYPWLTFAALTLGIGAGCKGSESASGTADDGASKSGSDEGAADEKQDEEAKPKPPSFGGDNPFAMLDLLKKRLDEPGPYDAPKQSADYDAEAPHWLTYTLSGSYAELEAACRYSVEQYLAARRVAPEELFHPTLMET